MQPYVPLVIRAHSCPVSLLEPEVAAWLWGRLRDAFPAALAATVMPNHAHTLVPARDADAAKRKLGRVVNGLRRSGNPGASILWSPASAKGSFSEPIKIARQVRYINLNPNRAKLVGDPLSWWWTTHRDVIGALCDPWVTDERLASVLGRPVRGFRERWHDYVSGDPSVCVSGTPAPVAAALVDAALVPLGEVLAAALVATRSLPAAIRRPTEARRLFIALAARQGWGDATLLARLCGVTKRTARWYLAQTTPIPSAALLCLGDARLRAPLSAPIHQIVARMLQDRTG